MRSLKSTSTSVHKEKRFTRVGLIEAVPQNFKSCAPRTVAKMLQEPAQSVFVRETTTPKENMSEGLFTRPNVCASGLRHIMSAYLNTEDIAIGRHTGCIFDIRKLDLRNVDSVAVLFSQSITMLFAFTSATYQSLRKIRLHKRGLGYRGGQYPARAVPRGRVECF